MTIRSIIFGVYIVCIAITLNAANSPVALWSHHKTPHTKFIGATKYNAPLTKEAFKKKNYGVLVERISWLTQRVRTLKVKSAKAKRQVDEVKQALAEEKKLVGDLKKELQLANEFKSLVLSEVLSIESKSLGASSLQSSILIPDDQSNSPVELPVELNDQEFSNVLSASFSDNDSDSSEENPGENNNGAEK